MQLHKDIVSIKAALKASSKELNFFHMTSGIDQLEGDYLVTQNPHYTHAENRICKDVLSKLVSSGFLVKEVHNSMSGYRLSDNS